MRSVVRGLLLAAAFALVPAVASAAEPAAAPTTAVKAESPTFPTPFTAAVVGLSLTAVVVVGARAAQRTSDTMMYMVLATVALTGVFIAASHRIHSNFDEKVNQLRVGR
jgi:amino acid transporter